MSRLNLLSLNSIAEKYSFSFLLLIGFFVCLTPCIRAAPAGYANSSPIPVLTNDDNADGYSYPRPAENALDTDFKEGVAETTPVTGPPIPIIKEDSKLNPDCSYRFEFETGNGITFEETGTFRDVGEEGVRAKTAQGSYSYTSPEGKLVSVTYIADENGFRPQGEHIPTAPPIPPAIQEALEQIAANGGHPGDAGIGTNDDGPIDNGGGEQGNGYGY